MSIAVVTFVVSAVTARGQNTQVRRHYEASSPAGGVSYEVTELFSMPNDTEDRHVYLVQDNASGDRLTLSQTRDYLEQTDTYEVVDLQTKERIVAEVKWPYKSVTRKETLEEMHRARSRNEPIEPVLTIEMNGIVTPAREGEIDARIHRDRRSALRSSATAQFLERLERLRPIVGARGRLTEFCAGLLKFVLYNETCNGPADFRPAAPDCDFDAAFRYACSDRQKERTKDAKQAGKVLTSY